MSWNLSFIRTYADTVVHHAGQAVVGGAKLIHNTISSRNIQSFQQAVKRLEAQAVSSKGNERVLMLKRWLKLLKEADDYNRGLINNEVRASENMIFYQDVDQRSGRRGELLTFLDVFLHSEALEGTALSMIHEEPNDEEAALLLEIFGHSLMGGKDIHLSILSSIRDLAGVFLCYRDEVLMKREELLQFAQSSISGLKISAEQSRLDTEIMFLKTELMREIMIPASEASNKSSKEAEAARTRALKEALVRVRDYSKLKALLLIRKAVNHGDSPGVHAQKLDKLKILTQALAHSSSQAQNTIEDQRRRREEAISIHDAKVDEVNQVEKDYVAEIEKLQRRKDELEAELEQVNSSLASANAHLCFAREEKLNFDKATSDILHRLQCREQELLRSISLGKTETEVASAWISFIESTWSFQCHITKQDDEFIKAELGKYAQHFESILMKVLPPYKNELLGTIEEFKEVAQKLQNTSAKRRDKLEAEYHEVEGKVQSAFSVVETVTQLLAQSEEFYRKDDKGVDNAAVNSLLNDLHKVKEEFDSLEKPDLTVETPTTTRWKRINKKLAAKETRERLVLLDLPHQQEEKADLAIDGQDLFDSDDELMAFESDYVTVIKGNTSMHELQDDWEL